MPDKSVMIIEDEGVISLNTVVALQMAGFRVMEVVPTAERAMELMRANPPALAIIDIALDGKLSGIDLAMHISERHSFPYIFMTAHNDGETLSRARDTKPFGILGKPCENGEIVQMVRAALA